MVITVGSLVSIGTGPAVSQVDTYDSKTNQLTIPSVVVGSTTYNNVVITVGGVVSVGGDSNTTYFGQFIDAPTKGLVYTSSPSGLSGTTDDKGAFKFKAGDTVSFAIPTTSGNIAIGVYSPPTPTSTTDSSIVHVSIMDNGSLVAQTLQSLGGTGSMIDLSKITLTTTEKIQIADFIASGAITPLPAKLTINEGEALFNAMASLNNLATKTNTTSLSALLNGSVIVHTGVMNLTLDSDNWAGKTIKLLGNEISFFKSDNTVWSICVNAPWIDTTIPSSRGNICRQQGIFKSGGWSVPTGSTNSVDITDSMYPSFLDTVTFRDINSKHGLYTSSQPNAFDVVKNFTGFGAYLFMSNTWNKSYLAGATYYVGGFDQCTDGIGKFVYNNDATSFVQNCKTARIDGGSNTATVGGTLSNVTEIPGLAKITFSDGSLAYVGVAAGSTQKSGRSILMKPGDSLCGTGETEAVNGQKQTRSLSRCGSIKIVTYNN